MYYIFFYNDNYFKRTVQQYGYYSGRYYTHHGEYFPVCSHQKNEKNKSYTSIKRAKNGGFSAIDKFGYVTGFDIEDINGNVLYRSYKHKEPNRENNKTYNISYNSVQINEENGVNNREEPVCQIVEIGVGVELKLSFKGIDFYTHIGFNTENDAKNFAERQGLKVVCNT